MDRAMTWRGWAVALAAIAAVHASACSCGSPSDPADGGPLDAPRDGGACATADDCDDGVECTTDDCVGGRCENTPSDNACDDGVACNGEETCSASDGCEPGTPPMCDDGITCTMDGCGEPAGACLHAPDDTACPAETPFCAPGAGCVATRPCATDGDCDDGQYCNGAESCGADRRCVAGVPLDCNDEVPCTLDYCREPARGCVNTADDTLCPSASQRCDAAAGCIARMPCTTAAECDDGVFCNGEEQCMGAELGCVPGTPPLCDDGLACTTGSCDAASDACVQASDHALCPMGQLCMPPTGCVPPPECMTASDCDDGLFCNGAEACTGGRCAAGAPPACADTVMCTVDACDEGMDRCASVPDDVRCSDGRFCNGAETCSTTAGCVGGMVPTCDDSLACTADSCDDTAGCVFMPNDGACDDGRFCNGAERCAAGLGCVAGTVPMCMDADACTTDACSDALARCTFTRRDLDMDGLCDDIDPDVDNDGVLNGTDFAPRDPAVYNAPIVGGDASSDGGLSDGTADNALTRFFTLRGHYRVLTTALGTHNTPAATITLPIGALGPAARVARAYLYRHTFHNAVYFNPALTLSGGGVATSVVGECRPGCEAYQTVRGDVTAHVAAAYAARAVGATTLSFPYTQSPVDWAAGASLVVVFEDPSAPPVTASLVDGMLGDYCAACGVRYFAATTIDGLVVRGTPPGGRIWLWTAGDGPGDASNTATITGSLGSIMVNDITEPSSGFYTGIATGDLAGTLSDGDGSVVGAWSVGNDSIVGWALVVADTAIP